MQEDHDDDPFNKFLEAVEGLVQQFFNPAVAFTSVPLNENDIPVPVITTPTEDKTEEDSSIKTENTSMFDSYCMVFSPEDDLNDQQLSNKLSSMTLGTKPEKR